MPLSKSMFDGADADRYILFVATASGDNDVPDDLQRNDHSSIHIMLGQHIDRLIELADALSASASNASDQTLFTASTPAPIRLPVYCYSRAKPVSTLASEGNWPRAAERKTFAVGIPIAAIRPPPSPHRAPRADLATKRDGGFPACRWRLVKILFSIAAACALSTCFHCSFCWRCTCRSTSPLHFP